MHARMQKESGGRTVGVCCQKVVEVEAMIAAGVKDVLLSNEVVDPPKIEVCLAHTAFAAHHHAYMQLESDTLHARVCLTSCDTRLHCLCFVETRVTRRCVAFQSHLSACGQRVRSGSS